MLLTPGPLKSHYLFVFFCPAPPQTNLTGLTYDDVPVSPPLSNLLFYKNVSSLLERSQRLYLQSGKRRGKVQPLYTPNTFPVLCSIYLYVRILLVEFHRSGWYTFPHSMFPYSSTFQHASTYTYTPPE